MTQYDDTNTFTLFVNDKGDNPKRPDRTGKLNINGTWYKLSGWIKDGKNGPFLSGKVQAIEEERKPAKPADEPFDDRIPF